MVVSVLFDMAHLTDSLLEAVKVYPGSKLNIVEEWFK